MTNYINVRYSLTAEEHEQLKRIQKHYEKKFRINKLSQTDVLRHMMQEIEASVEAVNTFKHLAAR